jgi:hypothetical protein
MLPGWIGRSTWIAAASCALVGIALCFLVPGDTAWYLGLALVIPLVLLIVLRSPDGRDVPPIEGPFGPP